MTTSSPDSLEGCNEILVATRPDVVSEVHRSFLEVGCDAVQTDTFGGAPWVLDEYDLGDRTEELNETAARLAREACDAFSTPEKPRFVVGSIGPGTRSPTLSLGKDPATTGDFIDVPAMEDGYRRQIRGLLDGGTDRSYIETSFDLLQIKAAVAAANDVFVERGARVPVLVQFTVEKDINTMLLGTEPLAAIAALDPLGIDVLGMNCATGPEDMREHVRTLARSSRLPISIVPNAGMPSLVDGATVYPLDPEGLAAAQREFVTELGVSIVGGCCGTTPAHLAAVVQAVDGLTPRPRALDRPGLAKPGLAGSLVVAEEDGADADEAAAPAPLVVEYRPSLASLYSAVTLEQDTAFLTIGERANANGSKAFKEFLLAEDWDATVALAKSQTREGAHVLDVCVDYVGREGAPDMVEVVDRYATQSTLPLVIDSTQLDVIETALLRLGGRAVINSVNLEDGRNKADPLLPLAKRYGAAVVVLAIDEEGQARTADWKLDVCERIARIAIDEFGLEPQDLIFDCLTFPLGSGQEDLRGDARRDARGDRAHQVAGARVRHHARGLQHLVRPVPRRPAGPQLGLPQGGDRPRPDVGDRAPGQDPAAAPHPRRAGDQAALDLIHDRRGEAGTSERRRRAGRQVRPAPPLHGPVRGRGRAGRPRGARRPPARPATAPPHHRRRTRGAWRPTSTRRSPTPHRSTSSTPSCSAG